MAKQLILSDYQVDPALNEANRQEIERMVASCQDFAQFTLKLFHDVVLNNAKYVGLIKSQTYSMPTYYMGLVDKNNKVNFMTAKSE